MEIYKEKQEQLNGDNQMLEFEKVVILLWLTVSGQITSMIMDQLRQSVGFTWICTNRSINRVPN